MSLCLAMLHAELRDLKAGLMPNNDTFKGAVCNFFLNCEVNYNDNENVKKLTPDF